jgi:hypothetical protein
MGFQSICQIKLIQEKITNKILIEFTSLFILNYYVLFILYLIYIIYQVKVKIISRMYENKGEFYI